MSKLIRSPSGGKLVQFDPQAVAANQAKANALINYAAKMHDWPLLEQAIDAKIDEQVEFVGWWDGTVRSAGNPSISAERGKLTLRDVEAQTQIRNQQVSRWRKKLQAVDRYRAGLLLAAYRKAGLEAADNFRALGTGENEWFTPAQYIELARGVMGSIDVDPATHSIAQETVQASEFFTRKDDGLTKEWHGSVWLNPPYAHPLVSQFISKLVDEFAIGHTRQALLLTHNYTDSGWFHLAAASASAVCFTRGRVKFIDIDGNECAPTQGQTFFYYGQRTEQFRDAFAQVGLVLRHA